MRIDTFEMERFQSIHWHRVDYDLSESGVSPLTIAELLGESVDTEEFLSTKLGYPLSEGSALARERIAQWYPGATAGNVTIVNGGSEANLLTLWTLLEPDSRLAFMVPNYMQGWGLGRHFGDGTDLFSIKLAQDRWALDLDELDRAVGKDTGVVMVCNPNNPTGHVFTEQEMEAVVEAARRVDAWLVADEIYRGAEVGSEVTSPTFWGRYEKAVITSGLSKAFGLPGLRVGWIIGPSDVIRRVWQSHDYTTLTPGMISDVLTAIAMEPERRAWILARTREIVNRQWPRLEDWLKTHPDIFRYVPPLAGAIAYAECELPMDSRKLIERIRAEQSVLLVPGEMMGAKRGIRFGYGYDIQYTLEGLTRVDEALASLPR